MRIMILAMGLLLAAVLPVQARTIIVAADSRADDCAVRAGLRPALRSQGFRIDAVAPSGMTPKE